MMRLCVRCFGRWGVAAITMLWCIQESKMRVNVREFAEYKELHPQSSRPRAVEIFRIKAKVFGHRVVIKVVHQLRKDPAKANGRKDGQTQIPQGHRRPPVPRGSVLEIGSSSDNKHPIQDDSDDWHHGMRYHPISERYRFIIQLQAIVFVAKRGSRKQEDR
jgi:hypothetical protein